MKRPSPTRKQIDCRNPMRILVLTIVTSLTGCGSNPELPQLSSVSGTVTLQGEPITEGQITLVPQETQGTRGPSFGGLIEEDGHFEIVGPNGREGVIPGRYQVVIHALPVSQEQLMQTTDRLSANSYLRESPIPAVYQSVQTTPLKVVVEHDDNSFQFQLQPQESIRISRSVR